MNAALEQTWTTSLRRIRHWRTGRDPTPVYEALGWAVVLSLTGDLDHRPSEEKERLVAAARLALTERGEPHTDRSDEQGDEAHVRKIAKTAIRVLCNAERSSLGDAIRPSPRRVHRMLNGKLDGLSAASCALALMRRRDAAANAALALSDPDDIRPDIR